MLTATYSPTTAPTAMLSVLRVCGRVVADDDALARLAAYVARASAHGKEAVIVHGGRGEVAAAHRQAGLLAPGGARPSLRSGATRKLTSMALHGWVNARLVAALVDAGVDALGLSGADLGLLRSRHLDPARLGGVGATPRVDAARLRALVEAGLLPVLSPVCLGPRGELLYTDPDEVACAVALALGCETLDLLGEGLALRTCSGVPLTRVSREDAARLLRDGGVLARDVRPLERALEALRAGVPRVRVGGVTRSREVQVTSVLGEQALATAAP